MATIAELEKNDEAAKQAAAKAAEALRQGRAAEASKHFGTALETANTYGEHWTAKQKKELAAALGITGKTPAAKAPSKGKDKKKGPAIAFYQLDSGETFPKKGLVSKDKKGAFDKATKQYGSRDKFPRFPNTKAPKVAP